MRAPSSPPALPLGPLTFDGPLGRQIVELHMWVVREGIRGVAAAELFDGICRRLVSAGVPLWRGFIGMPTLHPQWRGYSYTWRRDLSQRSRAHRDRLVTTRCAECATRERSTGSSLALKYEGLR
jgi:hypothetical protein